MKASRAKLPCACCGYLTLGDSPGSYEICHVCFWEDDPVQLLDPWYVGGANKVSLQQAQENFSRFGVSEQRFKKNVKGVLAGDIRDERWRPVAEADRKYVTTPAALGKEKPNGDWPWYYWWR
ncbi:MAG TPA: CPCC family cysteine-rich protein [Candidatus Acidoferrum sp.]|jgi:hypothetical protein|nr:CPCC family cysteine-rich protein [Candidatus Acidoferrum sp.]